MILQNVLHDIVWKTHIKIHYQARDKYFLLFIAK